MYLAHLENYDFIKQLNEIILNNIENEDFGVRDLVKETCMSHSSLNRRVQSILKKTINQHIRELRLRRAKELLLEDEASISEIAFKVGFGSPTYFDKCFHEYYGFPPGEFKSRHSQIHEEGGELYLPESDKTKTLITTEEKKSKASWLSVRQTVIYSIGAVLIVVFLIFLTNNLFFSNNEIPLRIQNQSNDKSIAVLPFKNFSEKKENQYFADGIFESIIYHLNQIKALRVVSRTTVEPYHETSYSAPEIGRILGVNYLLEGSVSLSGGKVKVIVRLINAKLDSFLLSEEYNREQADIFEIQSSIARQVAKELKAVLSEKERNIIEKVPTKKAEAYELYLKGRFFINKRTAEGLQKGMQYFEQAVKIDSMYALAYSGMADVHFLLTWYLIEPHPEGYIKAKRYALKAIELDNDLSEGHAVLGSILNWYEWKWEEAREELRLATEISPNNPIAHAYYSELHDNLGQNTEARQQINEALELDPLFPMYHILSSKYYYHEDLFNKSLEEAQKTIELDPGFISAYWQQFYGYLRLKREQSALDVLKTIMVNDTLTGNNSRGLEEAYNRIGINGVLILLINGELKKPKPNALLLARWYAFLGFKDNAIHWLDRAYQGHHPNLPSVNNDPDFDLLRPDLRFQAMIKQMNLTKFHQ